MPRYPATPDPSSDRHDRRPLVTSEYARPLPLPRWLSIATLAIMLPALLMPGTSNGRVVLPDGPTPAGGHLAALTESTSSFEPMAAAGSTFRGYGKATVGGKGGRRLTVRNLKDSGPGSLRAALEASGRRTVVFSVAGVIRLRSPIKIKDPFITVRGHTAPAPGIVVRGDAVMVLTHEVILRHLRLRPGDVTSEPADTDALTINGSRKPVYNVILDHLTMLWGPDIGGLAVLGDVRNVTVQYSIMGEGLYLSAHPEGKRSEGGHSHAANLTQVSRSSPPPRRITFWRNLFTTSNTRVPRFQGAECIDVVNNVIYNWGTHSAHGNPRSLNLVRNWYREGPRTASSKVYSTQTSTVAPTLFRRSVYEAGNRADGFRHSRGGPSYVYAGSRRCGGLSVTAQTPREAYDAVLAGAGATQPKRDQVDRRIITNVKQRTGRYFNGAGYPKPNPYW